MLRRALDISLVIVGCLFIYKVFSYNFNQKNIEVKLFEDITSDTTDFTTATSDTVSSDVTGTTENESLSEQLSLDNNGDIQSTTAATEINNSEGSDNNYDNIEDNNDSIDNTCGCPRSLKRIQKDFTSSLMMGQVPPDGSYVGPSSCNKYTSHLGSGQNVLSYSFYSPTTLFYVPDEVTGEAHWMRYLALLPELLKNMTTDYPGFRLRMYHNLTKEHDQLGFLCDLYCKNPHMDMCDMRHVPELSSHLDLESIVDLGRAWRFAVLGDPTVRLFGVRDLDMFILQREVDAMHDWKQDGTKQFYVLRDTPERRMRAGYIMPIKGGFWGGDNYFDFPYASSIRMNDTITR